MLLEQRVRKRISELRFIASGGAVKNEHGQWILLSARELAELEIRFLQKLTRKQGTKNEQRRFGCEGSLAVGNAPGFIEEAMHDAPEFNYPGWTNTPYEDDCLIAAAPRMYAALAALVDVVAFRGPFDELLGSSEQTAEVNEARAALKLARGEP